jgi:hypothetical protein
MNNNLTPTNWQEVQADLIARFNGKACQEEFTKLQNAKTFEQLFIVIFKNYSWLKSNYGTIAEIENITPIQYSTFMVWLLETYCLGKDVDSAVQAVIDLHKKRLNGEELTEEKWAAARYAASSAASAASDGTWYARYAASWAAAWAADRDAGYAARYAAACDAGWEQITNKLIEIIYE